VVFSGPATPSLDSGKTSRRKHWLGQKTRERKVLRVLAESQLCCQLLSQPCSQLCSELCNWQPRLAGCFTLAARRLEKGRPRSASRGW
jgi:hypothetical protein